MSAPANPLVSDLPENVVSLSVSRHIWNGVSVEVSEWRGSGAVAHPFPYDSETRLVALLDEVGSPCEPRLRANQSCRIGYTPRHMDFLPAGMEVWGFSQDVRFVRDATLLVDFAALEERLDTRLDRDVISAPRLRFSDQRIWPLMKLLADAVGDTDPSVQLYGDGLVAAIAAGLFAKPREPIADGNGLAPWQLRRVTDFLEAHLFQRVELAELAAMVGLSQSHFSRSFKASTGTPPYRWQLNSRIRRARTLLLDTDATLEEVAQITGFADAVHFGRTFRRLTGATPAAWRRDRKG
ncbi:AraC family transcriptional regulator [Agrobacterium sp. B1(2019)]|jgi:AraC-like DNA-binding protein|uniref:AraC family transcriptional regulator n=1 Tax=Agrobacterium sp. B1(2019) TaxID=2607032 RepID=UPI0011EFE3A0|nr:AraC family transcriptional regulator [Agrobacterium sp. B1(2019)]TZG31247.1 helix-turn-helix transcriptional regulator [Agrobacterium sp. B1(2019)]